MKKYSLLLLIFLLLGGSEYAFAQLNRKNIKRNNKRMSHFRGKKNTFNKDKRYNYIGLSLNAFNYFGDLAPLEKKVSTDISFTRPGYGITFGHRFGPRYTFRGSFTYGTIKGDDFESADATDENAKFRYVRNLQFRNRIKELTITAMFDLFKNESSYISRIQFTPYAFAGITVFHHNPQALVPDTDSFGNTPDKAGEWVNLEPLGTEGQYSDLRPTDVNVGIKPYKKWQLAIPFGIGVRYRLNQILDLSFESGVRYTFTDYLDDVSENYVDASLLPSDLARTLAYRSGEANAVVSGEERLSAIGDTASDFDGDGFFNGYGTESRDNVRGNKNENDLYFVTTLRVSWIIGGSVRRAKFR